MSDDGSWIFVDHSLVVANGGHHPPRYRGEKIFLKEGKHPFRVRYFNGENDSYLLVRWKPPGGTEVEIPSEAFSHQSSLTPSLEVYSGANLSVNINSHSYSNAPHESLILPLLSGVNTLRMQVDGTYMFQRSDSTGAFRLRWQDGTGSWERIPANALSHLGSRTLLSISPSFAWACSFVCMLISLSLLYIYREQIHLKAVLSSEKAYFFVACGITALGFYLRFYEYAEIPYLGDTLDELTTTWLGWNLLHIGRPIAWVWPDVYHDTFEGNFLGQVFLFANYCFHPMPLLGLFAGFATTLGGTTEMMQIQISFFRIPALVFSSLTIPLTIALARHTFGKSSALLAGALFATLPVTVLLGRLNKEDNMLAFFAVAAVLYAFKYTESRKSWAFLMMLFSLLMAVLSKEVGVFVTCACMIICLRENNWKGFWASIGATLVAVLVYLAYGQLNWQEFMNSLTSHGNYAQAVTGVLPIFSTFRIPDFQGDGWLIWLWLCAATSNSAKSLIAPVSYLVVFAFMAVQIFDAPWYRIPLLPFLCIPAGYFLLRFLQSPNIIMSGIFVLTAGISTVQMAFVHNPNLLHGDISVKLLLGIIASAVILTEFPSRWKFVRNWVSRTCLIAFFILNVYIILSFSETFTGV